MTAQGEDILAVDYLYGIDSSVHDDDRFCQAPHVVKFPVVKQTLKRVYYEINGRTRFVDRERLEADGKVQRPGGGWWETDLTVYLTEPVVELAKPPTLDELKAAMRAAHPDLGGSHEAFLAAHQRYEHARKDSLAKQAQERNSPSEGDCLT